MGSPTIAEKYSLLRKLGHGGMAEVFLARQEGLQGFQKLVVIKRILPHRAEDGEFVTMFLDEARTAADLRHPNVVNIFDINRDAGTYYMAMEFLHGHDVRAVMKQQAKSKESFPLEHALQIVLGAAAGLDYAHKKSGLDGKALEIVHRDVSPQNLIVGFSGEVKVVDFGIAKAASATTETEVGVVKGKFAYMAPEQARGERVDHRADQFALGAILWELLTLRRLFKRKSEQRTMMAVLEDEIPSVRLFRPDLSKELAGIVARTLERDPDRRFPDCGALRMALEDFLAEARVPHSQARLGDYMRTLFKDTVESEATLSEALLDEKGQLVERSESDRSLPVPDRTKADRTPGPRLKPPKEKPALEPTVASPKKRRSQPSVDPDEPSGEDQTRTTTVPTPKLGPRPMAERPVAPPPDRRSRAPRPPRGLRALKAAALALVVVTAVVALVVVAFVAVRSLDKGLVIVRSEPKGARMTVDGELVAEETPHILKLRAGREVRLSVSKDGYASRAVTVVVPTDGTAAEVFVELEREDE